jgi:hypothetical protein
VQKSAQESEKKELEYSGERRVMCGEFQNGRKGPPTPLFFVSADCKGFAGGRRVSADFARLKVAGFSVIWEGLVCVGSKGLNGAICLHEGKQSGSADSKGVGRTAWRGRMVHRARKNRADLRKDYNILIPYVNDYFKWFGYRRMALRGSLHVRSGQAG